VITHPDKVLFPDEGITKGELASYYESIAPLILPHIRARPLTMERYPAGIAKKGFWQKDVSRGFPNWLERVEVPKKDGVVHLCHLRDPPVPADHPTWEQLGTIRVRLP
jgi:bifunctional non-homologous end joining protein LigD